MMRETPRDNTHTRRTMIEETVSELRRLKQLAENALAQVQDADFFASLDPEANSLAVQAKHVGGNLRSRWTDFLTTDGEKPDRNRDDEFMIGDGDTREALMQSWEAGWRACIASVEALGEDDLRRTVYIRGEAHSVARAIQRSLAHSALHVGQIVLLAKHYAGPRWKTLSIPRGGSVAFEKTLERGR
jgi:hypothetical protein